MSTIVGQGDYQYRVDRDWAKLPKGCIFHEVVDAAVDRNSRVYIFSRGEHPLMIFEPDGTYVGEWAGHSFKRPHGLTIGPDQHLYMTDDQGHFAAKYTLDGEMIMTLGRPGEPAPFMSNKPFNQPTKVAVHPDNGDLYISDGYGNAAVHRFSARGEYISSWGRSGVRPGQFNLVHSVAVAPDGRVFVADRENHRLQIFDAEGNFLEQWTDFHRPCGLFIAVEPEPLVLVGELPSQLPFTADYPNLGARVTICDLTGRRLAWLGDVRPGEAPNQFWSPHGLTMDSRGDIYVGEVSWSFPGRDLDPPRELPCFRKLIRM